MICFGIALLAGSARAQRPRAPQTDGRVTEFPLPHPNSGATTVSIAADGTLWFTGGAGNRIGRMAQDGSGPREFDLPPGGSPTGIPGVQLKRKTENGNRAGVLRFAFYVLRFQEG